MANIYDMSDTWDDGSTKFTAIKMDVNDTESDSGSLLLDLKVNGETKFSVSKSGNIFPSQGGSGGGQTEIFTAAEAINKDDLVVLSSSGEAELVSLNIGTFSDSALLGATINHARSRLIRDTVNNRIVFFTETDGNVRYSVLTYDAVNNKMVTTKSSTFLFALPTWPNPNLVVEGAPRFDVAFDTATGQYLVVYLDVSATYTEYYDRIFANLYSLSGDTLASIETGFLVSDPNSGSNINDLVTYPCCEYNSTDNVFGVFYVRGVMSEANYNTFGAGSGSYLGYVDSVSVQYSGSSLSSGTVSSGPIGTVTFTSRRNHVYGYRVSRAIYNSSANKFLINIYADTSSGDGDFVLPISMSGSNTITPSSITGSRLKIGDQGTGNIESFEGTSLVVATAFSTFKKLLVIDVLGADLSKVFEETVAFTSISKKITDSLQLLTGETYTQQNAIQKQMTFTYVPSSNKFLASCAVIKSNPTADRMAIFDFTVDPLGASYTFGDARIMDPDPDGEFNYRYIILRPVSDIISDVAITGYATNTIATSHSADTIPNYNDWIGISNNDAIQGAEVTVTLPSGIHTFTGGLQIGSDYVPDVTGNLILSTSASGRIPPRVGRAITTGKMVLYPYRFY